MRCNYLIQNIKDKIDQKQFYNFWTEKISYHYRLMNDHFQNMYSDKNNLDNDLRFLYVQKLINYYTSLVKFHDNYFEYDATQKGKWFNYNIIYENVDVVIQAFDDLEMFMKTVSHFNKTCFDSRPLEFHFLRENINYWVEN